LTFDDNSAQKQKSDKITFSKLNLLPLKFGGNACFLKNYGISVNFYSDNCSGSNMNFSGIPFERGRREKFRKRSVRLKFQQTARMGSH